MFLPDLEREDYPELARAASAAFVRLADAVAAVKTCEDEELRCRAALIWSMAHGTALLTGEGAFVKLAVVSNLADRVGHTALSIARS